MPYTELGKKWHNDRREDIVMKRISYVPKELGAAEVLNNFGRSHDDQSLRKKIVKTACLKVQISSYHNEISSKISKNQLPQGLVTQ